jgi:ketosteroid isomerase-like protein
LLSMSQDAIETVRAALAAYAEGDVEGMLSFIDPEAELHSAIIGGAEGRIYRGHDGFRAWFSESHAAFEELTTELTEFRDLGEQVVGFGRIHAKGRESGVELDSATGWVFSVPGGKIMRAEGFLSESEALRAAGLSE